MKETGDAFEEQRKQALAPTLTKYQELQTKWKSLKSAHELELESKVQKDRDRDKRNYKNNHHTGRTDEDLALDALVDNGGIKVTSKATQADERALRQAQQNVRSWNRRSATASARANKGLRPYKSSGSGGGTSSSAKCIFREVRIGLPYFVPCERDG